MSARRILKTVGVYTENEYLFQKIRLELLGVADAVMLSEGAKVKCDRVLIDADDPRYADKEGIRMSRGDDADLTIPFRIGALSGLIETEGDAPIELIESQRSVRIADESVKLTELEYALFSLIFSKSGEYASREEILETVWDGRADKGIVNVYIHYLREKLERGRERIIISSRNYGYKISEKFIGGKEDA